MSASDSFQTNQYMTFSLAGETYGIEIAKIREILVYPEVTKLPNTQEWLKGVINLRGEVVPVIDMRIRFRTCDNPLYDDKTIVITVKTKDQRMLGLVVDEVKDIENIELDKLLPAPEMGSAIDAEYLKGLIKKGDKMIVIMDAERILDRKEMEILSSMRM